MSKNAEGSDKSRMNLQVLTTRLYQSVIDDTISKVKPEFVQEGVDESVLDELRSLWEATLVNTGVLADENEAEEEESEDEEEPVGGHARPQPARPTPAQVLHPVLPGGGLAALPPMGVPPGMGMGMRPLGMMMPPHYAMMQQFQQMPGMANQHAVMAAMAAQYQQMTAQAGWQGQIQAAPGVFQGGYAPPAFPMPAAAPAAMPAPAAAVGEKRALEGAEEGQPAAKQLQLGLPPATIPQRDGPADDAGEQPAEGAAAELAAAGGDLEGEGDELNEGDDLADVDDHEEIDEESIKNVMVGQFDKVHRTKTKWKINLRGCVATINGKDYLLKKVTGEMNF